MDVGPRVGARPHTRRGGAKRSTRSEAESCAGGLSWHNRPYEGELNKNCLGLNGAKRNESRVRMKLVRDEVRFRSAYRSSPEWDLRSGQIATHKDSERTRGRAFTRESQISQIIVFVFIYLKPQLFERASWAALSMFMVRN